MIECKSICFYCGIKDYCCTINGLEECDPCSRRIARFGIEKVKLKKGRFSQKGLFREKHKNEVKANYA